MMKYLLWFLFCFIGADSLYASCDSTVIQFHREKKDGIWSTKSYFAQTYNNGLLRKENDNGYWETIYYYDSLNRVKEILLTNKGTLYKKTNYDYFYYLNGADSVQIENDSLFYNNLEQLIRRFYFYDTNLNLQEIITERFNLSTQSWDTLNISHLYYSPDSLNIIDSTYNTVHTPLAFKETTLDSLGRIIQVKQESGFASQYHQTELDSFFYDSICIFNKSKEYSNYFGYYMSIIQIKNVSWIYDSLCRPTKCGVIQMNFSNGNGPFYDTTETDYVYLDCSHLVVFGLDTSINCPGQTDTIKNYLYIYGGTGNYTYSWTPSGLLSNDTILDPVILSDSNMVYVLTVHDSLGNSTTYQFTSVINSFTTVVTDASCNTCNDGSVELIFPVPFSNTYFTISPSAGTWNGSSNTGLPVGNYLVCSNAGPFPYCKICDSVHISSPNGIQMLENKYFSVFPNPTQKDFFVRIDPSLFHSSVSWLLRDSQGRELKKNTEFNSQFKVDVTDISNGIYYFEIFITDNPSTKLSGSPEMFRSVKKIVIFGSFQ